MGSNFQLAYIPIDLPIHCRWIQKKGAWTAFKFRISDLILKEGSKEMIVAFYIEDALHMKTIWAICSLVTNEFNLCLADGNWEQVKVVTFYCSASLPPASATRFGLHNFDLTALLPSKILSLHNVNR